MNAKTDKDYVETIAENVVLKVLEKTRRSQQKDFAEFTEAISKQISDAEHDRKIARDHETEHYEKRRNDFFELATGRPADDIGEFRKDADFLAKLREEAEDNKRNIRAAVINYGVPTSLAGIVAWVITHWK